MPQKIAALILAGGQSSRMNYQDKALMTFKNKFLISHVIEALETQIEIPLDDIYISCNANKDAYQTLGFPLIDDRPFPSEGPLCAIAAGLTKIDCDYLLIAPCDCPFTPHDYLNKLFKAISNSSYNIACISSEGKMQPLFSLIKKECLPSLEHFLASGERKTQTWFNHQSLILVADERTERYFNINTPENLRLIS